VEDHPEIVVRNEQLAALRLELIDLIKAHLQEWGADPESPVCPWLSQAHAKTPRKLAHALADVLVNALPDLAPPGLEFEED